MREPRRWYWWMLVGMGLVVALLGGEPGPYVAGAVVVSAMECEEW